MLRLPDQNWIKKPTVESPVVPAAELNNTATPATKSQLTVAADRAPLRVLYGRVRIGAQIANVVAYGSSWVIQAVWGDGPLDAIESVWANDAAYTGTVTHYLGDAVTPTVDPTLAAAFLANGIVYADTLPGIAYSVLTLPAGDLSGMPQLAAVIRGRQVYDPRTLATAWSENPALCLADFLASATYGLGMSIDWSSVEDAADECDALVSGAARRTLGLALDTVQDTRSWVEALRTYAGVWVFADAGTARLVPDRPRATDLSIDHDNGDIAKLLAIKKRGTAKLPNRVEVIYTDTSATPWRDASQFSPSMGLATGLPDSQVRLPGVHSASQAYREAVERLNKLWLADMTVELELFDAALAIEIGDVIEVTHPVGLSAKKLRVLSIAQDYGRFRIAALEYDPAVYSDAVATAPTYPDTSLPNPASPPAPTGLVLAEEVFQQQNGTWASRIRLTWTASAWPYLTEHRVEVWESGALIYATGTSQAEATSPAVQEGKTYNCRVATVSSIGAASDWAADSLTALGKYLPPGPVPAGSFAGYEAGGIVFLSWAAADDIDIWRYRLKYADTGTAYADATELDVVDALRYQAQALPVGTWRFWVEAVDSVRNESGTPRYVDVVVTLDNAAFLVASYDQTAPTTSGLHEYALNRTDGVRHFVTDNGASWNSTFTAAMNTYNAPVYTYFASVASSWTGESEDFGQDLGGDWQGTATIEALSGSVSSELQLAMAATPGTWVGLGALSGKGNGRFARMVHTAASGNCMHIEIPTQTIRLDAVPREEVVEGTSSSAGATTITLTNSYAKAKRITVQPSGTTARFGIYDNVDLGAGTVDVYIFNDSGALIVSDFMLIFQGV